MMQCPTTRPREVVPCDSLSWSRTVLVAAVVLLAIPLGCQPSGPSVIEETGEYSFDDVVNQLGEEESDGQNAEESTP